MTACHGCGDTEKPLDPFSKLCVDCLIVKAQQRIARTDWKAAQANDA